MSFGISVGDLLAISKLAWTLYNDCFLHFQHAPQEFRLLADEFCILCEALKFFEEDIDSLVSKNGGEERKKIVSWLIRNLQETLEELKAILDKHQILGMHGIGAALQEEKEKKQKIGFLDRRGGKARKLWDRLVWMVDKREVDGLRQKLANYNEFLLLLLTSVGNSSLQRIETTAQAINTRITQMQEYFNSNNAFNLMFAKYLSAAGVAGRQRVIPEEHIVYKRFGKYQAEHLTNETPCYGLFLLKKTSKAPRVLTNFKISATLKALKLGGADIDSRDEDCFTTVLVATERYDSVLARMLITELGADTALRYSFSYKSAKCHNPSGLPWPTILQFPSPKGYDKWYIPQNDVKTALYEAVQGGHIKAVAQFLDAGYAMDDGLCLPSYQDVRATQQSRTPKYAHVVDVALKFNNWQMVKYLLSRGVPVTDPGITGKSDSCPFLINTIRACALTTMYDESSISHRPLSSDSLPSYGSVLWDILPNFEAEAKNLNYHNHERVLEDEIHEILQLLVKFGADRMGRDIFNNTVLHHLVRLTHWSINFKINILTLLLSESTYPGHNLLINAVNIWNITPLHYYLAMELVSPDMVKFMIDDCGARVDIEDCDGLTALEYAIKGLDLAGICSRRNFEKNIPATVASIIEQRYSCIWLLLQRGARADAVRGGLQRRTTLHYVVFEVIALLKDKATHAIYSPQITDMGATPCHRRVQSCHYWYLIDIIWLLRAYDADPTVRDYNGYTPRGILLHQLCFQDQGRLALEDVAERYWLEALLDSLDPGSKSYDRLGVKAGYISDIHLGEVYAEEEEEKKKKVAFGIQL